MSTAQNSPETDRRGPLVRIDVDHVCAAARALALAGRYGEARALLGEPGDHDDGLDGLLDLALAAAEVTYRRAYVRGRPQLKDAWDGVLDDAVRTGQGSAAQIWDAAFSAWRRRYAEQLRRPDGTAWMGPAGRSPVTVEALRAGAERMSDSAPDGPRRGWAQMCLGWTADNIRGAREEAPDHYRSALEAGRAAGDDMLVFEAQRHLGDHAHDDGDHPDALRRWVDSTTAAARAGHLAGVLAQQLLLAVLARDVGEAGAGLLAREVARWSDALGAAAVAAQAEGFLAGADPTRAPE